jgi:hypothetical protein
MRALFLAVAALAVAASLSATATHEPRVWRERYTAGTGDAGCVVSGFGCVRFFVEDTETAVRIVIDDDLHDPVAANYCSPDCNGVAGIMCGEATASGLKPGDPLVVFIDELTGPLFCPGLPFGTAGTVTATFT